MYTPVNPSFTIIYIIKVGCKGVYITRTCYPDDAILSPSKFVYFQNKSCIIVTDVVMTLLVPPKVF